MNILDDDIVRESSVFLVLGGVDAGKSTLTATLKKQAEMGLNKNTVEIDMMALDDGNGLLKNNMNMLRHEIESGRTSTSKPHYILTRNDTGNIIATTLIDLCGHDKYSKTTIFGVSGLFGDYGIIIIGANMGINGTTHEHMRLLAYMRIPFIIVITKLDLIQSNDMLQSLFESISRLAHKYGNKKTVFINENQLYNNGSYISHSNKELLEKLESKNLITIPVITISNKTGHNLGFLKEFITSIKNDTYKMHYILPKEIIDINDPATMFLDGRFTVRGVGMVLSGTVRFGNLRIDQDIYVGPIDGNYLKAKIKTMKNCVGQNVDVLLKNTAGSIGVSMVDKKSYNINNFRKGQIVCTDPKFAHENTCYSINAMIMITRPRSIIRHGSQCVLHCGTVRHTVVFVKVTDAYLGKKINARVKFIGRPEFIAPDSKMIFRDGNILGLGRVTSVINFKNDTRINIKKNKKISKRKINTT